MSKAGKRIGVLFLTLVVILCIAGCQNSQGSETQDQTVQNGTGTETSTDTKAENDSAKQGSTSSDEQDVQKSDNTEVSGSDILVVYFSRTGEQYTVGVIDEGNTAIIAKMIADKTGADLFEVLPVDDHYPMTYDELTDVAKQEQNDNARPEYAGEAPDLSQYNTIFIGAPVWWGDWPMIMYTFFEENADALAGKTLIPFSTHAGSGLSGFDSKLSKALPDSTVGTGLAIEGTDAQNDQTAVKEKVSGWLTEFGY
jgi:flavodoxin